MGLGDKKTWVSWLGWTVLLFGLGCFLYMERQKQIPIKAKSAFAKAVVEEKNLFIDRILSDYDVHRSKDTIPGNEKREWADQSFLTLEDVNRHRLDSLFRLELRREEVPVLWCAVSCVVDGKIHAVRKDLLQEDFLLVKQVYRIDNEEENNIVLRAYVQFGSENLLNHGYAYLLLGFWLAGLYYFYCLQKRQRKDSSRVVAEKIAVESKEEIKPLLRKPIAWTHLGGDLYFDEQCGVLKRGERTIQLKNMNLLYFRAFLGKEHYTLTYEDFLMVVYGQKSGEQASRGERNRISKEITGLREQLKSFDIEIHTITGMGYCLKLGEKF